MDEKKNPANAEEAARQQKMVEESKWETIFMVSAVIGTILFISGIMVSRSAKVACVVINVGTSWSLRG